MTSPYMTVRNRKSTPQSQPIPGSSQKRNNAGGYSFTITPWQRLRRFLILGSEAGTYYVSEKTLTATNASCVEECLALDYRQTIDLAVEVSTKGLGPKNTPSLLVLALGASDKREECRRYALSQLEKVARIGTHMFQFVAMLDGMRGWGAMPKKVVANWYLNRSEDDLAYQLAKYQNREGWTARDVMRTVHPNAGRATPKANILGWATGAIGFKPETGQFYRKVWNPELKEWLLGDEVVEGMPSLLLGLERAKTAEKVNDVVDLIKTYGLTREMIPTQFLSKDRVWEALLPKMGLTALVRNLGNMTKVGYLAQIQHERVADVSARLTDAEQLHKSRVHPIQILIAMTTYNSGQGYRSDSKWDVVPKIVSALNDAFYMAFDNVEPTGKRIYIGVDVSSSMMGSTIAGTNLTAAQASAAMAMLYVRTEEKVVIKAFADQLKPLPLHAKMSMDEVLRLTTRVNFGGTDCALPILDALKNKMPIDLFIVLTDNETWAGQIHPAQALQKYRAEMGIDAKLVVIGMTATEFSIADPNDPGMLDVVGMDASVPNLIRSFALGEV